MLPFLKYLSEASRTMANIEIGGSEGNSRVIPPRRNISPPHHKYPSDADRKRIRRLAKRGKKLSPILLDA